MSKIKNGGLEQYGKV